jgi:outer membrane protein TolC
VNAAREEAQDTAADLETASLSLHAELAYDYFELRAADSQQRLLDDTVKAYTETLRLATTRFEGGAAPKSDVAQRKPSSIPHAWRIRISVSSAQYEHAIAILLGKPPSEFTLAADPLNLQPPVIPIGVPAQLLERRPDIAAVERRTAEANEQIGIARAAYYPTVSLSAAVRGFVDSQLAHLAEPPLGSRTDTHTDAVRRRAATRHIRRGTRRL